MSAPRTTTLVLAGVLGFGSLVGIAGPALADSPPAGTEMVLVLGEGGGGFEGPGEIAQPDPAPQPPEDKAPVPQPDPEPQPQPVPGPGEIAQPQGHGDPEPEPDLPIANPEDDGPVVNPDLPEGPGDIKDDQGCEATHGCEPEVPDDLTDRPDEDDDCHPLAASCELTDREPSDEETPGDEIPGDDDDAEVLDEGQDRGALPRTGAGLAVLAAAGGALTGIGATLRKLARR